VIQIDEFCIKQADGRPKRRLTRIVDAAEREWLRENSFKPDSSAAVRL